MALTPWGVRARTTLAIAIAAQGRDREALSEAREATDIMRKRLKLEGPQQKLALGEQLRERSVFERHVEIGYSVYSKGDHALASELIQVIQYPHLTDTATALQRTSASFAEGEDDLAKLIKARQKAVEDWLAHKQTLLDELTHADLDHEQINALRNAIATLASNVESLDQQLWDRFEGFGWLTQPRPVALDRLQETLAASEALLLQVTTDVGTYLAFVTPEHFRLTRTDLTADQLSSHVASLREAVELRPGERLGVLSRFYVGSAHSLYLELFAPFEAELEGLSTLFFVPDRAMQNITPAVLLREAAPRPPDAYRRLDPTDPALLEPLRELRFLGLEVPIAILPSAGSLITIHRPPGWRKADATFLGFAPLRWQASDENCRSGQAASADFFIEGASLNLRSLTGSLCPLPAAEEELEALAHVLGAPRSSIVLQAEATESAVKSLSPRAADVIAFATHALIHADQGWSVAEPALIMHIPEEFGAADENGVLFASEIAQLRLEADWVVLSACNTGTAGREGAEGLSGLAKAFFHAGARSLLVTHWWVETESAKRLTTGTFEALKSGRELSRPEALRASMLSMATDEKEHPAWIHPFFWAPFTVVGAGR